MFIDFWDVFIKSGYLVVVGNWYFDYYIKFKKLFGGVKVFVSDKKFVILGIVK